MKMAWAMGFEHGLKGLRKLVHRDGRKYPKQEENNRYNSGYKAGAQRRLDQSIVMLDPGDPAEMHDRLKKILGE